MDYSLGSWIVLWDHGLYVVLEGDEVSSLGSWIVCCSRRRWSKFSGIMDCMLFWFMCLRVSVVWHHSLPLMNSFIKNKAAGFSMKAMLPEGFHVFLKLCLIFFVCPQLSGESDAWKYSFTNSYDFSQLEHSYILEDVLLLKALSRLTSISVIYIYIWNQIA